MAKEWQSEQKQRDEMINKKITMQADHIRWAIRIHVNSLSIRRMISIRLLFIRRTLLEDRQSLIAKNSDLLRDMLILRKEVERLKGVAENG